ncbi:MAG: hypothetical protein LUG13_03100 [Oscillospiraceae bacterium]|nr:hypothetical protein [Oscillospiraceae bacterium]
MGGDRGGGGFPKTKGGRANSTIHEDKHIEGTKNYIQQRVTGKTPRILTAPPISCLKKGLETVLLQPTRKKLLILA